jgi:protein disulfide-isomerase A6
MRVLSSIVAAAAFVPMSALAGMYGDPVINLDAKSFKKAMATEHASVSRLQKSRQSQADI